MISYAFVTKEVPIKMGLILKDYHAVGDFTSHKHTPVNHTHNFEQLACDVNKFRAYLCTSTHAIHNKGARSTATKVGFSKNLL
jgi:hypothetical protein